MRGSAEGLWDIAYVGTRPDALPYEFVTTPEPIMKVLLIAAAFVAGPALACPADGSKDADAGRPADKAAAASTAKPALQARAAKQQKTAPAKVAVKSAADTGKAPPL